MPKTTSQHRKPVVVTPVFIDARAKRGVGRYCFIVKRDGVADVMRFTKRKDAEEERSEAWKKARDINYASRKVGP